MKKVKFILFPLMIVSVMALSHIAFADSYSNTIEVFKKSDAAKPFSKNCYGYALFPTVGKGGLMYEAAIGGQKFDFIPKQSTSKLINCKY